MAAACVFACFGLDCLNAWLDFSAPKPIRVLVHRRWTERHRGKTGYHSVFFAEISRLDHAGPNFTVPWDSCKVSPSGPASPFATVRVGSGAFGIPWMSLPVECHPLEVSDRPLAKGVTLGRGAPVVLVTVGSLDGPEYLDDGAKTLLDRIEALPFLSALVASDYDLHAHRVVEVEIGKARGFTGQERAQLIQILKPFGEVDDAARTKLIDRALEFARTTMQRNLARATVTKWIDSIGHACPGVPKVIVYAGSKPDWASSVSGENCEMVRVQDIDHDIGALFMREEKSWHDDSFYVADGKGKRVFSAPVSELERLDCAKLLPEGAK